MYFKIWPDFFFRACGALFFFARLRRADTFSIPSSYRKSRPAMQLSTPASTHTFLDGSSYRKSRPAYQPPTLAAAFLSSALPIRRAACNAIGKSTGASFIDGPPMGRAAVFFIYTNSCGRIRLWSALPVGRAVLYCMQQIKRYINIIFNSSRRLSQRKSRTVL